ncbi:MAG: immunoglobulin domain-containing protein, partial [Verrucomicrobia bacterium]|nr:immunoglobulin domain-containing protein [Verrucomicrobiota bacterium]
TPQTWIVLGDLPDGVSSNINYNAGVVTISGTPTEVGSFPVTIQAWQRANMRGDRGPDLDFTIVVDPLINQQPLVQGVDLGGSTELSVAVSNPEGVTFQWQKQNAANSELFYDLLDQTGAVLSLTNVTLEDSGNYRVVVTKGSIIEVSEMAMVTVNSLIAQQPSNQSVDWNGSTEITVLMKNPEGVTYQWEKQNADNPELYDDLFGETGAVLNLTNVRSKNSGNYQVIATKGSVIEVSMNALLTVNSTPFQAWLDANFEDPFSVEAGEEQNNDFDTFNNLLESLFGGDPEVADSFPFPEVSQEVINETRYAVFRYPAVPVGTESQITPEATDDLVGNVWTPLQNGVEGVIIESSVEGYFVKIPSELRIFLRLFIASAP